MYRYYYSNLITYYGSMMKWIMVMKVILLKRINMCTYYDYGICFKRRSHISRVFLLFGDEGPGPLGLLLSNLREHWGVWGALEDVPAVVVDCLACVVVVSLTTVTSMDTVTEGYMHSGVHPQITTNDPWHPYTTLWSTQIWMTLIGWQQLH